MGITSIDVTSLSSLNAARDALIVARAQGVRHTTYEANGIRREIEWRTDIELKAALTDIEQRIGELSRGALPRHIQIRAVKGY